jgi:hypothetical protein
MIVRLRALASFLLIAFLAIACSGDVPTGPAPKLNPAGPRPSTPVGTALDVRMQRCPTAAEVATNDIVLSLGAVAASRPLVCRASEGSVDITYQQRLFLQALILMKELRFDAPLPWTTKPLYEWFRDLGVGIHLEMAEGNSTCCSPGPFINAKVGTSTEEPAIDVDRVIIVMALLVHEARHLEAGGHPCQRSWDNRVADLGSWGVQVHFYEWLALHADPAQIPTEFRDLFLHRACTFRYHLFCQEPPDTCVGWPR